jgi:hypothetical protein
MNKVFICTYKDCGNKITSNTGVFYCATCGSTFLNPKNVKDANLKYRHKYKSKSFKETKQSTDSSQKKEKTTDPNSVNAIELKMAKTLGLNGRVTREEIKKSYKKKMKEYHPDKVANMAIELQELALRRTKEITEAYEYFKKKYGA